MFPIPSRMLLKYPEIAFVDTRQDDPRPHRDLGTSAKLEKHESSLRLSRKGLSQIARAIHMRNLEGNQLLQAHPSGDGNLTRLRADMSLARRVACDLSRVLYVSTVIVWRWA